MTDLTDDEVQQRRLAEDRHRETMATLKELKALLTVAASTVITDPEALQISVANVIKDAE